MLPFKELSVPPNAKPKPGAKPGVRVGGRVITPKLLGGEEVVNATYSDPRQPIVDWMRDADNPYFARAFVNRVWAKYFGAGLIDPPDDLNLANPPSNPELLDYLADGFVSSKFDMKWLHRTIVTSHTYQRSWKPNETNTHDERNHSRAVLRRLPAEVVVRRGRPGHRVGRRAEEADADPAGLRAIGRVSGFAGVRANDSAFATNLFGKPVRAINCDCERSNEPACFKRCTCATTPKC